MRAAAGQALAAVVARWKANGALPFALDTTSILAEYQQLAVWLSQHSPEGFALFMDAGTGKTPVPIDLACRTVPKDRMFKALVIGPKNIRLNWARETEHFRTVDLQSMVLRGDKLNRIKLIAEALVPQNGERAAFVICSYDIAVRMVAILKHINWDLGILDESHGIKDPNIKRTRALLELRDSCQKTMALTGTPVGNNALDLFAQLEWLGAGMSGFRSWKNFKQFYGIIETDANGVERVVGITNKPFMRERLSRCCLVIRKEEVLPYLPEKVFDTIEVPMNQHQAKVYEDLRDELVAEIRGAIAAGENRTMVVQNSLTQLLRLSQITAGFMVLDAEFDGDGKEIKPKELIWFDEQPKIDSIIEALDTLGPESKAIVWSNWVPTLLALKRRCEQKWPGRSVLYYGKTSDPARKEAEDRFNDDPTCKIFIGNPAAGGLGLNLVGYDYRSPQPKQNTNADWVLWLSHDWSMLKYSQAIDRAHRRNTRNNVRITYFCCPNTIDETIHTVVQNKQAHALDITDLNAILESIAKMEVRIDE